MRTTAHSTNYWYQTLRKVIDIIKASNSATYQIRKITFSGMWRRLYLVWTEVSEEHFTSTFSYSLLPWLVIWLWRQKRNDFLNCPLTCNRLYGVMSQTIEPFLTTSVRTSMCVQILEISLNSAHKRNTQCTTNSYLRILRYCWGYGQA
jgi:hypothetical protein